METLEEEITKACSVTVHHVPADSKDLVELLQSCCPAPAPSLRKAVISMLSAARSGSVDAVREFVQKNPDDLNAFVSTVSLEEN